MAALALQSGAVGMDLHRGFNSGVRGWLAPAWVVVAVALAFWRPEPNLQPAGESVRLADTGVWADAAGEATIEQVADVYWAENYRALPVGGLPPAGRVHWYRLRLENRGDERRAIVLQLGSLEITEAELYFETQVPGTFVRQIARQGGAGEWLGGGAPSFPIELQARSAVFAFVRVDDARGGGRGLGAVRVWTSREAFESGRRAALAWAGFVFGILVAALAYHGAVFAALRQRETAPYLVHLACFGVLQAALLLAVPEGSAALWAREALRSSALALSVASLIWFSISLLETRRAAVLHQTLLAVLVLWLVLAAAAWWPQPGAAGLIGRLRDAALAGSPALLVAAGLLRWRRRSPWAGVFLVAFSLFLAVLSQVGIERLQVPRWTAGAVSGLQAAAAFHMVAVSAALALRLRRQRLKDERARAGFTERLQREVRQRTAELESTSRRLAETNSQKDRLLAILAHDLRSPLNSILATSDQLARRPEAFDRSETARFASGIRDVARGLGETLENLLSWARLQTNRTELRRRRVDLSELVAELERLFRGVALPRSIRIEIRAEGRPVALTDYEAVRSIGRNFLSNAIKFSRDGGVVRLGARLHDGEPRLWVEDEGPGLTAEQRAGLFRLCDPTAAPGTEERGAGLGLVLCAELAGRLGGRIEVWSEPGRGSRFELRLPIECVAPGAAL